MSTKLPLGAIARLRGRLNCALVPTPSSLKPLPLPAKVVVAPVVLSLNSRRPRRPWKSACVMKGKRVVRWPQQAVYHRLPPSKFMAVGYRD